MVSGQGPVSSCHVFICSEDPLGTPVTSLETWRNLGDKMWRALRLGYSKRIKSITEFHITWFILKRAENKENYYEYL